MSGDYFPFLPVVSCSLQLVTRARGAYSCHLHADDIQRVRTGQTDAIQWNPYTLCTIIVIEAVFLQIALRQCNLKGSGKVLVSLGLTFTTFADESTADNKRTVREDRLQLTEKLDPVPADVHHFFHRRFSQEVPFPCPRWCSFPQLM